jgi:hypothetical protein
LDIRHTSGPAAQPRQPRLPDDHGTGHAHP